MPRHYIGLISGTSMDGVDAVLASFGENALKLSASHAHPYPDDLRRILRAAILEPDACGLDELGALDRWVGECFRDAARTIIANCGLEAADIVAIGSHGQTLRHQPNAGRPFSLQIGDAATIAEGTGIATVSDFRRADVAAGGQGAPLTPPFHQWLFATPDADRIVLNLGGIANITLLPGDDSSVIGFDTGPGNTLLDAWVNEQRGMPYDSDGKWAAAGKVSRRLLDTLLGDAYFDLPPPKSTGFEYFNLDWLRTNGIDDERPVDVQATLAELTAVSVSKAIRKTAPATGEVFVCGGGVHNEDLLSRLRSQLPEMSIESTSDIGLDPDWVEAAAFAWLAMRTMDGKTGSLPSVTGASHKKILGAIHYP
ncbi:MAG: anhydro-N-acetylmuramic acid kinase [Woeseiaceae bacterium]